MAQRDNATYVSLDSDVLKMAHGSCRRGKPQLHALFSASVALRDEDAIAALLQQWVNTLSLRPSTIEWILPRHFAIVRNIELPSTEEKEIRQLASFQAVNQTPYTIDEMVWDCQVLHKDADSCRVLMVVVQKEIVQRLLDIAQKARLNVRAIRLSTQAYEAAFLAHHPSPPEGPCAFLSMESTRSHLLVCEKGQGIYSRSLPVGYSAQAHPEKMASELRLSFLAYRKEFPQGQVHAIYLEADNGPSPALIEKLQLEGFAKTMALNPLLLCTQGPTFQDQRDKAIGVSLSELLGGLIAPAHLTLNLLPEQCKQQIQSLTRRKALWQVAIFSCVLLALGLGLFLEKVISSKMYLHALRVRLQDIESKSTGLEAKSKKLDIVHALSKSQGALVAVVHELYRLIPETIALNTLSYEREHAVIIKGTAKDMSDVFALIPALEKSPYFENVTSQYASKRRAGNKEVTDFQIQCLISKATAGPA